MNSKIINCISLADQLKLYLKDTITHNNLKPTFATILVGDNPSSKIYVHNKQKLAAELGINNTIYTLSSNTTKQELINLITTLNQNKLVNGILLQLPLPNHLLANDIIMHIDPIKDIDGLHYTNIGKLITQHNNGNPLEQNKYSGFAPATAMACMFILFHIKINLSKVNCCVIGRSNLVGLPLFNMLNSCNATVSLLHKNTTNISQYTLNSQVIIVAAGSPNLLTANLVQNNPIVIDVGINVFTKDNVKYIVGDCDTNNLIPKIKLITSVPNGVGKLTIPCLMINVIKAHILQN